MPISRLLLILAIAITAAGLTVWGGLLLSGTAGLPPLWMAMTGVLSLALLVRLLLKP